MDWRARPALEAADLKSCCVTAYESEWVSLLLGESWHPGGLAMTMRAGEALELGPGMELLDVACGQGASAIALAERFGCRVRGIDLSVSNIEAARRAAAASSVAALVSFEVGDAERIPLAAASVDALLCECAFCTFPSKERASEEFARVLRPGGALCLTDVTREGVLPPELDSLFAQVGCIADARSADEYRAILERAGAAIERMEAYPGAVRELLSQVRLKLLGVEVAVGLGKLAITREAVREAKSLLRATQEAVDAGTLGYALLAGRVA